MRSDILSYTENETIYSYESKGKSMGLIRIIEHLIQDGEENVKTICEMEEESFRISFDLDRQRDEVDELEDERDKLEDQVSDLTQRVKELEEGE